MEITRGVAFRVGEKPLVPFGSLLPMAGARESCAIQGIAWAPTAFQKEGTELNRQLYALLTPSFLESREFQCLIFYILKQNINT